MADFAHSMASTDSEESDDSIGIADDLVEGSINETAGRENDGNLSPEEVDQLYEEALRILGEDPELGQPKPTVLNPNLVSRWKTWIQKGLKSEERGKLKPGAHDASFLAGSLAGSRAGCHAGCEVGK